MSLFGGTTHERALTAELLATRAEDTKSWLLFLARANFNARRRSAFYRFMASYIERKYRTDDALTAIYLQDTDEDTRQPRSVVAFGIPLFLSRMKMDGATFASAFQGWAPPGELMALHAFEENGLKPETLRYLAHSIRAAEATTREIRQIFVRMFYVFVSIQVLAYGMAYYVVPKIYRALPAKAMTSTLEAFRDVFEVFAVIGPYVGVLGALVPLWFWWALPNLTGPLRERIDRWPVFLTYREWQGSIWLRSLAALVAAQMQIPAAMKAIAGRGTPYMNYFTDAIIENLSVSLPDAMKQTGTEWPSAEMITALGIFLSGQDPEQALQQYADEWLTDSQQKVQDSLANLRLIGYIVGAVAGVWFYVTVNDIILAFTNI